MEDLFEFAMVGAVFALSICLLGGFHVAIEPLKAAAKNRRARVNFSLAEVLCLFVSVQLQLAVAHCAIQYETIGRKEWVSLLTVTVLMASMWWYLVQLLSRAGVRVLWHRCVVIVAAIQAGWVFALLIAGLLDLVCKHPVRAACILPFAAAIPGIVLYGLGRFITKMLESIEPPVSENPSDANGQPSV